MRRTTSSAIGGASRRPSGKRGRVTILPRHARTPAHLVEHVSARSMCQTARSWAEAAEHEAESARVGVGKACGDRPSGTRTARRIARSASCMRAQTGAPRDGTRARSTQRLSSAGRRLAVARRAEAQYSRAARVEAIGARSAEEGDLRRRLVRIRLHVNPVSGEPLGSQAARCSGSWPGRSCPSARCWWPSQSAVGTHFTSILFEWMCTAH